ERNNLNVVLTFELVDRSGQQCVLVQTTQHQEALQQG
uniref:CSON009253 protein n=1 Tax=Culicoides sonorensis TaxID=179676 RepID=A0A336KGY8_CULSO